MLRQIKNIIFSIVSGFLLIIIFPKLSFGWLAWVCLTPLLYTVARISLKKSFFYGLLTGWVASIGIYYWVVVAIRADGQSLLLGLVSVCALSLYLSLYSAVFSFLFTWTYQRKSYYWIPFIGAAGWVSLEFLRTYLFTGFPWLLIGYSQWQYPWIIQCAEWGGIYLISFLIVLANIIISIIILERNKKVWLYGLGLLLTVVCVISVSSRKIHSYNALLQSKPSYTCALLQGNIDQYQKWNMNYEEGIKKSFEQLINAVIPQKPDLIIWPETSLPGFFEDYRINQWINTIVKKSNTFNLVGTVSTRNKAFYNSIVLLDGSAQVHGVYDKKKLVLFGEYVPLANILGRWINVLNELGGFNSGQGPAVIQFNNTKLGTSVCFESIFPGIASAAVRDDAGVLINLTNDAWYLKSSAAYQHLIMNVFRAVENRRFVLRCANTGVSAIIAPTGEIIQRTNIFETTVLKGSWNSLSEKTFYTRYGDVFAWLCAVFVLGYTLKTMKGSRDQ